MQQSWVDYYKILEVDHQAPRAAIEASYKSLCKTYHPDINSAPDAESRMKMINIAWEVLRDDHKRTAYYREWLRRSVRIGGGLTQPRPVDPHWTGRRHVQYAPPEEMASRRVILQYFRGIQSRDYDGVYDILSSRDSRNIPRESFARWQTSVAASYRIEEFTVLSGKKYDAFPLGDINCPAERFSIEITERDLRTGTLSRYRLVKFAVKEGDAWHVYLGYRDIDHVVEQFSFLSGTSGEIVRRGTDMLTGLPNRGGFLEKSRPEAYRCARYGRTCAAGVASVLMDRDISDPDFLRRILQQVGFSLRATVRLIDLVGSLGEQRFCVLLAETDQAEAERAVVRIAKKVEQDVRACFDTQIRLAFSVRESDGKDIAAALERCEAGRGRPL